MLDIKTKGQNNTENVIIIGGGPAGLAAAIYTARTGLSPLVFAGSPPGGQLMLTSDVENYPGFESILGPELVQKYRTQSQKFAVRIIDQNITKVEFNRSPFMLQTAEKSYQSQSVILATGAQAVWLGLENERRLRGKGVSACATCDGFFFKDKIVAVIGGGDTAMEEALTLTKFARKVYIIHRRDQFRAAKIMQDRVFKNSKIEIIWNTIAIDILGENKVEGVRLKKIKSVIATPSTRGKQSQNEIASSLSAPRDDKASVLKVDGLFLAIGHKPDTELFSKQIELDGKGYIFTSSRLALDLAKLKIKNEKLKIKSFDYNYQSTTSVPGVFAAGDCVDYIYRQAGTAVGMGIAAALEVERWLERRND